MDGERRDPAADADEKERLRAQIRALEAELTRTEYLYQRTRRLIEMATDTVMLHDAEGRIVDANQHAADNLGYSMDELFELNIRDIETTIAKMPREKWGENWKRMEPGVPVTVQGEHRRKDGSTFPVEVRLGIMDLGHERLLLAIARDITTRVENEKRLRENEKNLEREVARATAELVREVADRRAAQDAAEEANAAKSRFMANMSHELRTPLNATIGYAEMIQEELTEAGFHEISPDLERIQAAGRHLLGLINDILDVSKIEAGRMDVYYEQVAVDPLVSEVIDTVRPLVERNENSLESNLDGSLGSSFVDVVKLRQILYNLLSNAAKFTKRGKITLRTARRETPHGEVLDFAVQDTGIGMSEEQLARIFEPFTQADASTTRKYGGTGLGLAISHSFCELLGGRIGATSELGVGTTFTVVIPVHASMPAS